MIYKTIKIQNEEIDGIIGSIMDNQTKMKLPKYLQERFYSLEHEEGLIDECKYVLTLSNNWKFVDGGQTIPVRSKKEALHFLRQAERKSI